MVDDAEDGQAARAARQSWLAHPLVAAHYRERGLIEGLPWESWVTARLGESPRRSLELQCGGGDRSLFLFERGLARSVDGVDSREDLVEAAERQRDESRAPGRFRVLDVNARTLRAGTYDLVFACHSFHHLVAIEHVMEQVYASLTPRGFFVIEGYVGPTRFQWTETQIELVRAILALLPDRLATFKWDARKSHEGRADPVAVAAVAPFDGIRSGEIPKLFEQFFRVVAVRPLGGTLQNLLYNGIVHNFSDTDPETLSRMEAIAHMEDVLIDADALPSDFRLLIGQRR